MFYLNYISVLISPIYLSWNTPAVFDMCLRVIVAENKVPEMIHLMCVPQIMTFISCWETNADAPITIEFNFRFSSRVLKILGGFLFEKCSPIEM